MRLLQMVMLVLYGNIFKVTRNRLPADVRFRRGGSLDREPGRPKGSRVTIRTPLRQSLEARPVTSTNSRRRRMNSDDSSGSSGGGPSGAVSRRASAHDSECLEMVRFDAERSHAPSGDDLRCQRTSTPAQPAPRTPTPALPAPRVVAPTPRRKVSRCGRSSSNSRPTFDVRRPFAAVECRRTDVAAAAAAAADGAARRENKAAKTLAIVVGGFVVCWTPFFVLYVVEPFCAACRASDAVRSVLTWLGYANSLLNPFIYATYNRHFRHSFWRLTVGQFPSPSPPKSVAPAVGQFRACLPKTDRHVDVAETRVTL